MSWRAELSDAAERQLKRLSPPAQTYIARAINTLETDPFAGDVIPLKGKKWRGRYRKRVGWYRVIFVPRYETHIVEISAIVLRNEGTYR